MRVHDLLRTPVVVTMRHNGYNLVMRAKKLHEWRLSVAEAMRTQHELAQRVSREGEVSSPRFIAGVDVSTGRGRPIGKAAVVALTYPGLKPVEIKVVQGALDFPYIPGLLSFREAPLILAACEQLEIEPDLIIVDGQGIAHPRRLGIASHLGLVLGTKTIGCAKSLLVGHHEEPEDEPGSYAEIVDRGEVIGVALRTVRGVKPVYVSIGNRVSLETAIKWVLACCRGYRLPEPVRLAHLAAGGNLRLQKGVVVIDATSGASPRLFEET